jgi:predicted DNA-binding mobile mystery protein A
MSTRQLARKLDVSQPTIVEFEQNESSGSITLKTLARTAEQFECVLLYALVPRTTLEDTVLRQAKRKALELLGPVRHSMELEAQAVSDDRSTIQLEQLAEELLTKYPRRIWD